MADDFNCSADEMCDPAFPPFLVVVEVLVVVVEVVGTMSSNSKESLSASDEFPTHSSDPWRLHRLL